MNSGKNYTRTLNFVFVHIFRSESLFASHLEQNSFPRSQLREDDGGREREIPSKRPKNHGPRFQIDVNPASHGFSEVFNINRVWDYWGPFSPGKMRCVGLVLDFRDWNDKVVSFLCGVVMVLLFS